MKKSAKTERNKGKGASAKGGSTKKAAARKTPPASDRGRTERPRPAAAPAATAGRYEPPPLKSDGWAPFRYPPQ